MFTTNISYIDVVRLYTHNFEPAIKVTVILNSGAFGTSICKSDYSHVKLGALVQVLLGQNAGNQKHIDTLLIAMDIDCMIVISAAVARAMAAHFNMPLYRYLNNMNEYQLPQYLFACNSVNNSAIDIKEVFLAPTDISSFAQTIEHYKNINYANSIDLDTLLYLPKHFSFILEFDRKTFLKEYTNINLIRDIIFAVQQLIEKKFISGIIMPTVSRGIQDLFNYSISDKITLIYQDDIDISSGNTIAFKASDMITMSYIKEKTEHFTSINQAFLLHNDLPLDESLFTDIALAYGFTKILPNEDNKIGMCNRLLVLEAELKLQMKYDFINSKALNDV